MPCDHSTRVTVDSRRFVVEYDCDGNVLRIKQCKGVMMYGVERTYHVSYWCGKSHVLGSGDTMPKRIIAAARAKMAAEDRSIAATP